MLVLCVTSNPTARHVLKTKDTRVLPNQFGVLFLQKSQDGT